MRKPASLLYLPRRRLLASAAGAAAVAAFASQSKAMLMVNQLAGFGGAECDPYYSSVVALLYMDGTDGGTVFTDQKGHTFTANGTANTDTAQSKFGGASLDCGVSAGDITTPSSADWNLGAAGSGNFTVEGFFRFTSTGAGGRGLISAGDNASAGWEWYHVSPGGLTIRTAAGSSAAIAWSPTLNTWHHLALERVGGTVTQYVDGSSIGNYSSDLDFNNDSTGLAIGAIDQAGGARFDGWIDEVRITKGTARYGANFTVSTTAFPNC